MNKKKTFLPILITMIALLMIGGASAAVFVNPTSSTTMTGTVVFNVTATFNGLDNCSITGSSANSGDTLTETFLINGTDATTSESANLSISSLNFADAADWTFTGTCFNFSNIAGEGAQEAITAVVSVNSDNGFDPVINACTIDGSTASNTTVSASTVDFACSVFNASSCNLYWKTSTATAYSTVVVTTSDRSLTAETPSTTYDNAGETFAATLHQAGDANQRVYMDCSDGTDTTIGPNFEVKVSGTSNAQKRADGGLGFSLGGEGPRDGKQIVVLGAGVLVLGLIFVLWRRMNKK